MGHGLSRALVVSGGVLANIAVLPLLPLVPASWEAELELHLRKKVHRSELLFGLVWLLPSGRFALWLCSACVLAVLVTALPPYPSALGRWEVALAFYTVGWITNELDELLDDLAAKKGASIGMRKYLSHPFNH